jgi:ABC-2 type transport system ATP-binding protein
MSLMHAIQAKNITKVYPSRKKNQSVTALNEFSLDIEKGEIFGLLGPNGAGKTTFIKVLLSIVYPTSGSASMYDVDISETKIKEKIGYLPENHKYPPYLTAEQVLRYFGKLSGLTGAALEKRITEMLTLVNMEKWRKVKIKKYSKGMMQRIGLAQSLVNQPELVFLDEPTDGVDPLGRKQIRDLLVRLRDRGTTVFLNSHLLSEVEQICDRVAILNKGKLLRLGTVDELTKQDQMFELRVEGAVPENLLMQWEAKRSNVHVSENLIQAHVSDLNELNKIVDQLRAEKILITGLSQKKSSLEDMFIEVIGGEEI